MPWRHVTNVRKLQDISTVEGADGELGNMFHRPVDAEDTSHIIKTFLTSFFGRYLTSVIQKMMLNAQRHLLGFKLNSNCSNR